MAQPKTDRSDPLDLEEPGSSVPAVEQSSMNTLFLGGGAYCFQRHMQYAYPGTGVDVAEIDRAVTKPTGGPPGFPRIRRSRLIGATPASSSS